MNESKSHMTQQLARVAGVLQRQRTGVAPTVVTAILSENTLVVTLDDALTLAEQALVRTPRGAGEHKYPTDNSSPVRPSRCVRRSRQSRAGMCERQPRKLKQNRRHRSYISIRRDGACVFVDPGG